jgi:hypothetical protein
MNFTGETLIPISKFGLPWGTVVAEGAAGTGVSSASTLLAKEFEINSVEKAIIDSENNPNLLCFAIVVKMVKKENKNML